MNRRCQWDDVTQVWNSGEPSNRYRIRYEADEPAPGATTANGEAVEFVFIGGWRDGSTEIYGNRLPDGRWRATGDRLWLVLQEGSATREGGVVEFGEDGVPAAFLMPNWRAFWRILPAMLTSPDDSEWTSYPLEYKDTGERYDWSRQAPEVA